MPKLTAAVATRRIEVTVPRTTNSTLFWLPNDLMMFLRCIPQNKHSGISCRIAEMDIRIKLAGGKLEK